MSLHFLQIVLNSFNQFMFLDESMNQSMGGSTQSKGVIFSWFWKLFTFSFNFAPFLVTFADNVEESCRWSFEFHYKLDDVEVMKWINFNLITVSPIVSDVPTLVSETNDEIFSIEHIVIVVRWPNEWMVNILEIVNTVQIKTNNSKWLHAQNSLQTWKISGSQRVLLVPFKRHYQFTILIKLLCHCKLPHDQLQFLQS